ncbi:MAG: Asp-tRNA(Asn)/Glu-tRNA(Gln) amidotransferase subunit GatC [Planctomycetes bacterium]|nr:Asp-tRNA(Asn)/Glu-tRNA(Gln) amidotransferase subunit GatC [Planctomycetota bacterium]
MALEREDVRRIAELARLELSSDELATLTSELIQIVDYVQQLRSIKTEGVVPLAHALDLANVFRDDCLAPGLPREAALSNAPKHDGAYFLVPAVLGE